MARKFYFEVTDIIVYAEGGNLRVSGIQRVQLNLIRLMADHFGDKSVRCLFYNGRKKAMMEFSPTELFGSGEYNPELMLLSLGVIPAKRWLPLRPRIREYLGRFPKGSVRRAYEKIKVYIFSVFFPVGLKSMGLHRVADVYPKFTHVRTNLVQSLAPHDMLIFLGANWSLPEVVALGREHNKQGGSVTQMIFDLIPHFFPEYCTDRLVRDFNAWLQLVSSYTSNYLCISENTARDLLRIPIVAQKKPGVFVVPLAHEFDGSRRNLPADVGRSPRLELGLISEYVLCVGTIEVRKNGVALLKAWLQLYEQLAGRLPVLVFAGKHGWKTEEFDNLMRTEPTLRKLVKIVDAPTDRVLEALYTGCLFTVYPSLYEGWGLPVGESAWFGKYCITSIFSSLPEVCGDLAGYVDPRSVESIVVAVRELVVDRALLKSKEDMIRTAKLRTWEDVAECIFMALAGKKDETPLVKATLEFSGQVV